MDKVKIALAALKKHHFWVLTVLVFLISVVVWFMGTSDLADQASKRKSELDKMVSDINSIKNDPKTQNETTIKEIERLRGKPADENSQEVINNKDSLDNNVLSAWTDLFEKQRKDNKFPPVFIPTPPGNAQEQQRQREFVDSFMKLWGPMEEIEKLPADKGLDDINRTHYQNHIQTYFPSLFEMIDRRHEETVDGTSEPSPPMREGGRPIVGGAAQDKTAKMVGIVDWDDAERVMAHFSEWRDSPSTLQVMMAQEDLWVYETLLKVIRNTNNKGSDKKTYIPPDNHKSAAIKRIILMEIGQEAIASWTRADRALINLGDAQQVAPVGEGGVRGIQQFGRSGVSGGAGSASTSPLSGRYLDDKGKPLADPNQQPYAEFRMMPINLRVVIEQKSIPKLLAECANSSMPIDVRAVRILNETPPPFEAAASADPSAAQTGDTTQPRPVAAISEGSQYEGMPAKFRNGFQRPYEGGAARDSSIGPQADEASDPMSPPVTVEVQGIIYIYNPPDFKRLGTGAAAGAATPDASATPVAPAAPPANPAATAPATPAPASGNPAAPAAPTTPPTTPAPAATPAPATPPASGQPATAPPVPAATGATAPAAPAKGAQP